VSREFVFWSRPFITFFPELSRLHDLYFSFCIVKEDADYFASTSPELNLDEFLTPSGFRFPVSGLLGKLPSPWAFIQWNWVFPAQSPPQDPSESQEEDFSNLFQFISPL